MLEIDITDAVRDAYICSYSLHVSVEFLNDTVLGYEIKKLKEPVGGNSFGVTLYFLGVKEHGC